MPHDPNLIKHTLSTILRTQNEAAAADVLDAARAAISFHDREFDTDSYRLDLRIPAVRFAQLDQVPRQLERIEEQIRERLWKLGLDSDSGAVNRIRIVPELTAGPGTVSIALPTASDESRIWNRNRLRLFLSHVSRIKEQTSALKSALYCLGIDGFVAHEDIEPSLDWQREVEFSLRSMDAFCALITPDYNASKFCDQEVGYALGRAVPLVLVSYEQPPYGLMGKQQATKGKLTDPSETAGKIFDVLAKQEELTRTLLGGLVDSLVHSPSFASAKASCKKVVALQKDLTEDQILRLLVATRDNSQVSDATGVPYQIGLIARRAQLTIPEKKSSNEFDDDIPF